MNSYIMDCTPEKTLQLVLHTRLQPLNNNSCTMNTPQATTHLFFTEKSHLHSSHKIEPIESIKQKRCNPNTQLSSKLSLSSAIRYLIFARTPDLRMIKCSLPITHFCYLNTIFYIYGIS